MATKSCPSCGEEVPVVATRCKSCFYDFNEQPEAESSGMLGILGLLATMAVIGMGVFWYLHTQVAAERVVVEEETQSIIITRKSACHSVQSLGSSTCWVEIRPYTKLWQWASTVTAMLSKHRTTNR